MGIPGLFLLQLFSIFCAFHSPALAVKRSYIVYLGPHLHGSRQPSMLEVNERTDSHYEILATYMTSKEKAKEAIFYSYTYSITGFAAILEEEEATKISKHPEVVSVLPNEFNDLHTTRSWEFLGSEKNGQIPADSLWRKGRFGEDVIIGNLDTGVWPESETFNDEGMGPIPSRWKGYCDRNDGVKCNRKNSIGNKKLIGARYFNKGFEAAIGNSVNNTARDYDGHGTHTLATAGGRFVSGANLVGAANGTAKGGSPMARVASYKVCWGTCTDADILAAIDTAIHDGIDILSISLGSRPRQYFSHGISIGSFHAVRNGIPVVCSAGNSGPTEGAVSNVAPWIITVAASTIDRDFPSDAILGNRRRIKGLSYNTNTLPVGKYQPLVYPEDVKAANDTTENAISCEPGSLDPAKVKGKIVYCLRGGNIQETEKTLVVFKAGGIGVILAGQSPTSLSSLEPYFVPTASLVTGADSLSILAYIRNTKSPKALIRGATEVGRTVAPIMASFSSPGPNEITPEILNPDITAPGVNILAAFTEAIGPSSRPLDKRRVPFTIFSGTSMSCPHIAGIAGLLKTIHPDWSPAAIKSAMMTTASTTSNVRQPILDEETFLPATAFTYGAGHVRPNLAPVFILLRILSLTMADYYNFLCSIGYNASLLSRFTNETTFRCPTPKINLLDLNYPSITVPNITGNVKVTRTLKNVGTPGKYTVKIDIPFEITASVKPTTLEFMKRNEEKKYTVALEAKEGSWSVRTQFGAIVWSDGKHEVRTPVVISKEFSV
ncbi:hypothetical protein K2173_009750 [Erythroxylum novogranatense]|uniref:Subtilisin-like protease SBT5.3 n=1 Tax=Erythroxylum novogranatense TaxID=1862640 RepID=A0AAV8T042_9ROSI|nr:hypothetical protein K2173_009750 [Erythroxylum novogranatense]